MNMSGNAMVKIIADGLLNVAFKLAFIKARIARMLLYFAIVVVCCKCKELQLFTK